MHNSSKIIRVQTYYLLLLSYEARRTRIVSYLLDTTIKLHQDVAIKCRAFRLFVNLSRFQLQFNFVDFIRVIGDVASVRYRLICWCCVTYVRRRALRRARVEGASAASTRAAAGAAARADHAQLAAPSPWCTPRRPVGARLTPRSPSTMTSTEVS